MGRLSGKVAFVTGAAMGNGKGGAEAYAKHGAHVVLADISPVLADTEKEFKEKGYSVSTCQFDVRDGAAAKSAADAVVAQYGKIDILLNNAGVAKLQPFHEMNDELRDFHIDINIKGVWNVAKAIYPHMMAAKYGRIVNMSLSLIHIWCINAVHDHTGYCFHPIITFAASLTLNEALTCR